MLAHLKIGDTPETFFFTPLSALMQNDIFINISWQGYGGSILSQFEGTLQIELFRKAAQLIRNFNPQADMQTRTNCSRKVREIELVSWQR